MTGKKKSPKLTQDEKDRLQAMFSDPETADTVVQGLCEGDRVGLAPRSVVRFMLGGVEYVQVNVVYDADGSRSLKVIATDNIVVLPRSSSSLEIMLRRR